MKVKIALLISVVLLAGASGQESRPPTGDYAPPIGLEIGQRAPQFTLVDQFGHEQSNETLKGPKGTIVLFFRSADWWPFCKAQLVQLQNAKERFEKHGLRLAAISYDNAPILMDFAKRHKIGFPMLADPNSQVIRSFNVLNSEAKGMTKGMAQPGFFFIDESGAIREKYFEAKYTNRFTANNVIGKLFPELTEEVSDTIEAPHLRLTLSQSDRTVVPGSRVTLTADVELPPDVHVYSPGVRGYKPIQLILHTPAGMESTPAIYPNPKTLYLEAIKEQVPVFDGTFRIKQDVIVGVSKLGDGARALFSTGKTVSIVGELRYQACDNTICYPPASVPLKWELQVRPLDLKRSPKAIQHK